VNEAYALIPQAIVDSSEAPAVRENVRIVASHGGMGVNPRILFTVADRLCADALDWQPFDHRRLLRLIDFSRPARSTGFGRLRAKQAW